MTIQMRACMLLVRLRPWRLPSRCLRSGCGGRLHHLRPAHRLPLHPLRRWDSRRLRTKTPQAMALQCSHLQKIRQS